MYLVAAISDKVSMLTSWPQLVQAEFTNKIAGCSRYSGEFRPSIQLQCEFDRWHILTYCIFKGWNFGCMDFFFFTLGYSRGSEFLPTGDDLYRALLSRVPPLIYQKEIKSTFLSTHECWERYCTLSTETGTWRLSSWFPAVRTVSGGQIQRHIPPDSQCNSQTTHTAPVHVVLRFYSIADVLYGCVRF